jgi:hypothetical protein
MYIRLHSQAARPGCTAWLHGQAARPGCYQCIICLYIRLHGQAARPGCTARLHVQAARPGCTARLLAVHNLLVHQAARPGCTASLHGQPARPACTTSLHDQPANMHGQAAQPGCTITLSTITIGWFNINEWLTLIVLRCINSCVVIFIFSRSVGTSSDGITWHVYLSYMWPQIHITSCITETYATNARESFPADAHWQ